MITYLIVAVVLVFLNHLTFNSIRKTLAYKRQVWEEAKRNV